MLVGLIPALRHAKSLLCLHLASNPGINPAVQKYYRDRLSARPQDLLRLNIEPENLTEALTSFEQERMTP